MKKYHIPFKHREKLNGHEIDFIVGIYAVEIDGHPQQSVRNKMISDCGFTPLHYHNDALLKNRQEVEKDITTKLKIYGIRS